MKKTLRRIYDEFEKLRFIEDINQTLPLNMKEMDDTQKIKKFISTVEELREQQKTSQLGQKEHFAVTLIWKSYQNISNDISFLKTVVDRAEYEENIGEKTEKETIITV